MSLLCFSLEGVLTQDAHCRYPRQWNIIHLCTFEHLHLRLKNTCKRRYIKFEEKIVSFVVYIEFCKLTIVQQFLTTLNQGLVLQHKFILTSIANWLISKSKMGSEGSLSGDRFPFPVLLLRHSISDTLFLSSLSQLPSPHRHSSPNMNIWKSVTTKSICLVKITLSLLSRVS